MERGLIESLSWPKNKSSIQHGIYSIYTMPQEADRIRDLVKRIVPEDQIEVVNIPDLLTRYNALPNHHNILLSSFLNSMHACLSDGAQLLLCPPDTIFSEGTIPTLLHAGRYDNVCVAVPHPRVEPTILIAMKDQSHSAIEPAQMVTLAWESLHKSWSQAMEGLDMVNSYISGVSWSTLPNGSYAIKHRLPTNYLLNFTPEDLTFFSSPYMGERPHFSAIDHTWPSACLVPNEDKPLQSRQRTIGSSDAAFIVEITEADNNVPTLRHANPFSPDAFCRYLSHNVHNGMNVTVFRPG